MAWWLKRMYLRDNRKDRAYWERLDWVSDSPGRTSRRLHGRELPREGDARPPWAPKYKVGDLLVIALAGDGQGRCPAIVRVEHEPRWEPRFVDRYGGPGEGDRWGVVTRVSKVHALHPHEGPTLDDIDVDAASTRRRGYLKLNQHQYELAERLIAVRPPRTAPPVPTDAALVPIEDMRVEGYDLMPPGGLRRATRQEQQLVLDYANHLCGRGQTPGTGSDRVGRYKIPVRGGTSFIYSDLFNASRNQLIEAKADCSRNSIRMAIGQLADYAHHLDTKPQRAVLLPEPPEGDLRALLKSQGVAIVWRDGDGFADDADSAFT